MNRYSVYILICLLFSIYDVFDFAFQSESYEVLDCTVLDKGLSTDYNDSAWDTFSGSKTRGSDGTTVSNTGSSIIYLYANSGTAGTYDFAPTFCIEFDYIQLSSNANIQLQLFDANNNNFSKWITTEGHYKIEVQANKVEWWINDAPQTSSTLTLGNAFIRFLLQASASFKFSNFKVYPI